MSNIKSITPIGKHQTYDLEVDHPNHQFYLANGVLTSNSHAVAYAIDSYWCAWLLTYHEEEWLCAYLESMSTTPEKRAKAFSEVKALGYTIVPIDINHASMGWTVLPGKKLMPSFLSCKGVGKAAVEEILENRPYSSIEQLLWNDDGSWRHSKFNKKALEALIKAGALESLDCVGEGKVFSSYHHMHEVLVENQDLVKKTSKKDPHLGRKNFYELARGLYDDLDEWSKVELAQNKIEVFGTLDVISLFDASLLDKLDEKGIKSIDDWQAKDLYWFCVQKTTPKKTKNGKNYLLVEGVGPVGKACRIMAWGWDGVRELDPYTMVVAEVDKNDFGYSTTMWKLKEVA